MRTITKIIVLMSVLLLVFACHKDKEPVSYQQENFSVQSNPTSYLCDFSGTDYYVSSFFIYHVDKEDAYVIYSPVGTYRMTTDHPAWQLRPYENQSSSIYNDTLGYFINGKLPNDEPVLCHKVNEIPQVFDSFIAVHEKLFVGEFKRPVLGLN